MDAARERGLGREINYFDVGLLRVNFADALVDEIRLDPRFYRKNATGVKSIQHIELLAARSSTNRKFSVNKAFPSLACNVDFLSALKRTVHGFLLIADQASKITQDAREVWRNQLLLENSLAAS